MPIIIGGTGSGGGSLSVPDDLIFANTTDRNNFFTANPSRLRKDVYVSVAGQLQKYVVDTFQDVSAVIKGPNGQDGQDAPEVLFQYSVNGTSGWSDTLNTSVHKYWRWSTDGGTTWSPDSIKFSAEDSGAGLTTQQEQDLNDNTSARHEHTNKAILDSTTGTFTLARQDKLDGVQDTFRGTFTDEAALNVALPSPTDGWAAWNTGTATVWSATGGVWADTLATSVGDMLKATYDPQGLSRDAFLMSSMLEDDTGKIMTGAERVKLSGLVDITSIGTNLTLSSGELDVKGSTLATFAETAIYDPTGVQGDTFRMDNMVEGGNTKILTDAERTKLAGLADIKSIGGGLSIDLAGDLTATSTAPDLTPYMDKATYDAGGVGLDSFNMDNMVEGTNTKILTSAERTSIADIPNKQAVISETNRLPVNLVGDGTKVLSENDFTANLASKLANIEDRFLGIFADSTARDLAYPTPLNGQYCKQSDTNSFWFYGAGVWTDTGSSSTGDMLSSLYDPQGVAGDAFNRTNHTGEQSIATITGLQAEVDKLPPISARIDNLEGSVNDPTVGLTKRVTDLTLRLDTPTTGLEDRVDQLEQNGGGGGVTITGAASTIVDNNLITSRVLVSNGSGKVAASSVQSTELSYITGLTSSAQTQLNWKQPLITGAATTVTQANLTSSRALASNSSGKISVSNVSLTELNRLDGVRSGVQSQLDNKQPLLKDSDNNTLKCKVIYGTFPNSNTDKSYSHGLDSGDVLTGFSAVCEYTGTVGEGLRQGMPPNFTDSSGFHYQTYVSNSSVVVRAIDSSNLYGRPITFLLWYT